MSEAKRVAVHSMGCRLNLHEGELIANLLPERFQTVEWDQPADVYVLNTCTVTARADMRARGQVRAAHRRNPDAKIVVTGCYAQTDPDALARMPEVSAVIGNHEKAAIPTLIEAMESGAPLERVQVSRIWQHRTLDVPLARTASRSRPFVKIQDGCNEICSFCKIPRARGRNRSSAIERVQAQVAALVAAGFQELVLTGVHMGCWGEDLEPARSLADLLGSLLELPGDFRLRLSSVEPQHFTPALAEFIASEPRVCPHVHLPLQSGDDDTLARMRRRYHAGTYAAKVRALVSMIPDVCIGADVIAGFPGESDAAFESTRRLIEELPLAYLHVFPFSPRDGTPAAHLPDQIHGDVKSLRCRALSDLSDTKWRAYRERFVGRTTRAVALAREDGGRVMTPHYLEVEADRADLEPGRLYDVRIDGDRATVI